MRSIRAIVWSDDTANEGHSPSARHYPSGIHECIAAALAADPAIEPSTAALRQPEHGLTDERLAATDVLLWWGHASHDEVGEPVVERVVERVWQGMGLILLHSAHFSKVFRRLMGTTCTLSWREAGERERVWITNRSHPIAAGLSPSFTLEEEEMYGEPFDVPEPMETIMISWFQGGEVFRSGLTWQRGAGRIFYFRCGHETHPTYNDPTVQRILRNAVRWAANPLARDLAAIRPVVGPSPPLEPLS